MLDRSLTPSLNALPTRSVIVDASATPTPTPTPSSNPPPSTTAVGLQHEVCAQIGALDETAAGQLAAVGAVEVVRLEDDLRRMQDERKRDAGALAASQV